MIWLHVWRKQPSSLLFLHGKMKIKGECVFNLWTKSASLDICLALNSTLMLPEHWRYRSLMLWLHWVLQRSGLYFIRYNIPCPFSQGTHVQDKDNGRIFIRPAKNTMNYSKGSWFTYKNSSEVALVSFSPPKPECVPCSQVIVLHMLYVFYILCLWYLMSFCKVGDNPGNTENIGPRVLFQLLWGNNVVSCTHTQNYVLELQDLY